MVSPRKVRKDSAGRTAESVTSSGVPQLLPPLFIELEVVGPRILPIDFSRELLADMFGNGRDLLGINRPASLE